MLVVFCFFLLLSLCSIIGYGYLFRLLFNVNYQTNNIGLTGIFGLFALTLISYITHIFLSHENVHNLTLLVIGLTFFLYYLFFFQKKDEIKYISYVVLALFVGLLIAKTNEDFPYYHLPNSLQFVRDKVQFGLGNLNHGFKHQSSIFILNSSLYFPKIDFYLFNAPAYFFLIFYSYFFISNIFKNIKFQKNKFTNILGIILLLFVIVKFNRIAEYGTDLPGQFLILMASYLILYELNKAKKNLNSNTGFDLLTVVTVLVIYAFTIKTYFIIFFLFPLYVFYEVNKKKEILNKFLKSKFFILSILTVALVSFFNVTATGCFLYPIKSLCFPENLKWGLTIDTVNYMNNHYEMWAKSGYSPNNTFENPEIYVSKLNWFLTWFNSYFLTKVSDFLLVIFLTLTIVFLFLNRENNIKIKNLKKNKIRFKKFYLIVIVLSFLWFLKFPQLRYGGYCLILLTIVIPFSAIFSKIIKQLFTKKKSILILILISLFIFNAKNLLRIHKEFNNNGVGNFKNFPLFYVKQPFFETKLINDTKVFIVKGMCWSVPSPCVRGEDFEIKKFNGYKFFFKK